MTLVELLSVLSILSILLALLMPAVQSLRETARRMKCSSRLRQVGLATIQFESQFGFLPIAGFSKHPDFASPESRQRDRGLLVDLLPYLQPAGRVNAGDSFAASHRIAAIGKTNHPYFQCPSALRTEALFECVAFYKDDQLLPLSTADYVGNGGLYRHPTTDSLASREGVFHVALSAELLKPRLSTIQDGLSNTLLQWESSSDIIVDPRLGILGDVNAFGAKYLRVSNRGFPPLNLLSVNETRTFTYSWAGFRVGSIAGFDENGSVRPLPEPGRRTINMRNQYGEPFAWHPGGCNVVFGDGHIQFLSDSIDSVVCSAMATSQDRSPSGLAR